MWSRSERGAGELKRPGAPFVFVVISFCSLARAYWSVKRRWASLCATKSVSLGGALQRIRHRTGQNLSQCRNCRKAPNLKSEGPQCTERLKLRRWAMGYYKTPIIRYRMRAIERPFHGMFPFLALWKQAGRTPTKTGEKRAFLARARVLVN